MTTIYLIRHSKTDKKSFSNDFQKQNESISLSSEGIDIVKEKLSFLTNIDVIYSSNYQRAIDTANIIASDNNLNINIDKRLGERIFGINSIEELPSDFERKQLLDDNYKLPGGESQKEVRERMYNSLIDILNANKGKNIVVVSHATAITFLLKKWCTISIEDKLKYVYKEKLLLHNYLNYCDIFKLTFDDNKVMNIEFIQH